MRYERKILWILVAGILILSILFAFSGCGSSQSTTTGPSSTASPSATKTPTPTSAVSQSSSNVVAKSADGSVSLSVPLAWNTNQTSLYPGAIVGVANSSNNEYVVITKKPKSEFGANSTINDYLSVVKTVFGAILTNPVWGQTSNETIGGCSGSKVQVSGTKKSDNSSTVYFVNALASKNYYYNVCGWTSSSLADTNKASIESIVNSFKETD
jgi:hypothetical protein